MASLLELFSRLWRPGRTDEAATEVGAAPPRRPREEAMVVVGDLDRDEFGASKSPADSVAARPVGPVAAATVAAVAGGAFVLGAAAVVHGASTASTETADGSTPVPSPQGTDAPASEAEGAAAPVSAPEDAAAGHVDGSEHAMPDAASDHGANGADHAASEAGGANGDVGSSGDSYG